MVTAVLLVQMTDVQKFDSLEMWRWLSVWGGFNSLRVYMPWHWKSYSIDYFSLCKRAEKLGKKDSVVGSMAWWKGREDDLVKSKRIRSLKAGKKNIMYHKAH